ncbi:MAG TPA: response regulator [Usitatibacteraceae bacterium]|nr:response regulator [Usitatibacteraceae bacterium]
MSKVPFQRILHVDDQPDIRGIVKLALGKIGGFSVCSCSSGQEALAAATEFDPELLLIDMSMPGMDGMDLLLRMREAGIHVPAIFFTARINPAELERYRAAGAIGTVSKPFDPLKLGRQITQIWVEHHAPKESPN